MKRDVKKKAIRACDPNTPPKADAGMKEGLIDTPSFTYAELQIAMDRANKEGLKERLTGKQGDAYITEVIVTLKASVKALQADERTADFERATEELVGLTGDAEKATWIQTRERCINGIQRLLADKRTGIPGIVEIFGRETKDEHEERMKSAAGETEQQVNRAINVLIGLYRKQPLDMSELRTNARDALVEIMEIAPPELRLRIDQEITRIDRNAA
ncbi:MAG: hypothetical protein ABIJ10_04765 [Candidatus Micrarchaeota archaeon]